ncbi:MAG TPA: hypothetical protein VJ723_02550, partial [Candidatus Angelobacter sp.]|nr:hypothetical protein [Candidatus Angelobacter sp.]
FSKIVRRSAWAGRFFPQVQTLGNMKLNSLSTTKFVTFSFGKTPSRAFLRPASGQALPHDYGRGVE